MKLKLIASFLLCASLFGAGVSISSITCASQVVTVNCTGCGIVQYQGFSISGASVSTYNLNSTAGTASTNVFTFTLPSGTPCNGSATGGTVLPAKQIINVSSVVSSGGNLTINYVSWFTVVTPTPLACNLGPSQNQCPVSAWPGASAAENAAIVAGTTIEVPGSITVAGTTPAATLSALLVAQYVSAQTSYNSGFLGYAGYWWTGTAWVNHN